MVGLGLQDGVDRRLGEYHALHERVAGQAVGAVQAGAGGLTHGVKTFEVGAPGQVGHHPAAGVVGGWHHRYGFPGDVDAQLGAARQDVGEMLLQELGAFMGNVEVHAIQTVFLHLEVDGARHHVARGEFGARIVVGHETVTTQPGRQFELAAFAAHGFGDEEALDVRVVQAGGVELDELHVAHPAASPPGRGDAVAGGGVGVGGEEVHLASAARGEDGVGRLEGLDHVLVDVEHIGTVTHRGFARRVAAGQLGVGDEIHQHVVLEEGDAGGLSGEFAQRFLHGRAGGVGGVHDAAVAVAAFPGQVQLTPLGRKRHAQFLQPGDGGGCVFHGELRGLQVAQSGAGHQGVVHMGGVAVAFGQHRGDATLGPVAGAVGDAAFGDHRHAMGRRQAQRRGQAGQAAADDEDVKGMVEGAHGRHAVGVWGTCDRRSVGVKRQLGV